MTLRNPKKENRDLIDNRITSRERKKLERDEAIRVKEEFEKSNYNNKPIILKKGVTGKDLKNGKR